MQQEALACFVYVIDCLRAPKLEVVHRHGKLAPKSGVEFRPMAPISGAGFGSVCQGPYRCFLEAAKKHNYCYIVVAYI